MAFKERIFRRPRADAGTVQADEPVGASDESAQTPPSSVDASVVPPPHELHDSQAAPADPAAADPSAPGATVVMPAVDAEAPGELPARPPGFRERGRMRRRLRYLREVRELGYRDLGGLIFDQHRFGRPNEALVQGKVNAIDAIDRESRALGAALADRAAYSELRVAGVSACQRCGGLHGSDARFCPSCGLAFGGPRTVAGVWAEHPVAPREAPLPAAAPAEPEPATAPDPAPEPAPADPAP